MKMKMKSVVAIFKYVFLSWILTVFLFSFSCKTDRNSSSSFNDYLSNYHSEIPVSPHYYVIISRFACQTCFDDLLPIFLEKIKNEHSSRFSFIIANQRTYMDLDCSSYEIIMDESGLIERLNMDITDFAIIRTKNGKIVNSWNFNLSTMNGFNIFLNKEFELLY